MPNEIYETFVDQFTQDVSLMEAEITKLQNSDTFNESVNTLFRIFHNHKALTSFLELTSIHKCVEKAENVLSILRQDGAIHDEAQIDWLYLLEDQMHVWSDELELGLEKLSEANEAIFTTLKLKETKISINEILGQRHLLYIDDDVASVQKFLPPFQKIFAKVTTIGHANDLQSILQNHSPDLLMIAHSFIDASTFRAFKCCEDAIPVIALTNNITKKEVLKLINQGVHYYIDKPIQSVSLKKVLHSVAKTHFASRKMIISNKKIRSFIETLDPLSDTVLKIQEVCDNEQSSIADLVKVVKDDPITSGMILNATKSPIYALKNITSVDQAVSIFGKRTVKALTLGGLSSQFKASNLSMYGINESTFQAISHMRMKLISHWFHIVKPDALDTLNVAALLSNLGQMLIAKEIVSQNAEKAFLSSIQTKGVEQTEYDFLHTTCTAVTSDIMYFWKMPSLLIDTISYSCDPDDAVEEVKLLALACHVVFALVPLTEATILPVNDKIKIMLLKNDLDVKDLHTAIEYTLDNKEHV